MRKFTIRGRILSHQSPNQGIPGLRVEAWDKDLLFHDRLGSAITNEEGKFMLSFSDSDFKDLFFDRYPDIFFKVYAGETLLKDTRRSPQWNVGIKEMDVYEMPDIFVDFVVEQPSTEVGELDEKGSTRSIYQATYTPRKTKAGEADAPNTRGLEKGRFIASLSPSAEEIKILLKNKASSKKGEKSNKLNNTLSIISSSLGVIEKINVLKDAKQFAQIDLPTLWQFADELLSNREKKIKPGAKGQEEQSKLALMRKNVALAQEYFDVVPVGYLHLEKLSFTPAGIERGELVYSLPLAPGEEVNISHKEWSHTEEEFERIVTDYLEEFSEEGVAEKSEFADAVNTQSQHSKAYNLSVSASGSYAGFNISSSFGYNASDSSSRSQQTSRKQAYDITQKASSRVKKEHKISFKVASAYETEDQQVRKIVNPFKDQPMRVDYYQLIRKWQVNLYRYGMRLTWDLAIPEPGSGLLSKLIEISAIKEKLTKEFSLEDTIGISADDISLNETDDNYYLKIASKHNISLIEIPPEFEIVKWISFHKIYQKKCEGSDLWEKREIFLTDPLEVSDGYEVNGAIVLEDYEKYLRNNSSGTPSANSCTSYNFLLKALEIFKEQDGDPIIYGYMGGDHEYFKKDGIQGWVKRVSSSYPSAVFWERDNKNFLGWNGKSGKLVLEVRIENMQKASFSIKIPLKLNQTIEYQWKQKIWNQMYEFKKAEYYENRQKLKDKLAQLEEELGEQDALSLRKKEREEIMKGVLRWLGIEGEGIKFYPELIQDNETNKSQENNSSSEMVDIEDVLYDPDTGLVKEGVYSPVMSQGEVIKFLHQAIEWENMLYFLYPYFWTHQSRWEFKKYLDHPDPQHKAFLKAGSARVVLTIRPGFEHAFLTFKNTGEMDGLPKYPYLSIGEEYRNFAQTNYPGIPPANPVKTYRPQFTYQQIKTWERMELIIRLLSIYFRINRTYPSENNWVTKLMQIIPMKDPWARAYVYSSQTGESFELMTLGKNGSAGGSGENTDIKSSELQAASTFPVSIYQYPKQYEAWQDMMFLIELVNKYKDNKGRYPTTNEGLDELKELLVNLDAWDNEFVYTYPGEFGEFDLASLGKDGQPGGEGEDADITSWAEATLIGQWYEYTPTSAMDIEIEKKDFSTK